MSTMQRLKLVEELSQKLKNKTLADMFSLFKANDSQLNIAYNSVLQGVIDSMKQDISLHSLCR